MIKIHTTCSISFDDIEKKKNCKKALYITLIVDIYHPDTNRYSKQTWYLCLEHWEKFKKDQGFGWYCYYPKKDLQCPVIGYKILG